MSYERPQNNVTGVLLALLGIALFTPIFAAGKIAEGAIPAMTLVWLRYFGGAMTMGAVVVVKRVPLSSLKSTQAHLHLLRACLGIGGLGCTIYAATVLSVLDATAIALTKGLIAIALAAWLLRERVVLAHWVAGATCLAGAYLVLQASAITGADTAIVFSGVMSALFGAVFMACEGLLIKVLARQESGYVVLGYVNTFAAIVFAIPGLMAAHSAGLLVADYAPYLLLGPLAIAGQTMNVLAYRRADAATIAPVGYSWILFSAILGAVWFGEVPGPVAILGAALILAGGFLLTRIRPQAAKGVPDGGGAAVR